jgi:MSHA biogenesis protein MshN
MSVINKMLRDLDQRQAKAGATDASRIGLSLGTAALADGAVRAAGRSAASGVRVAVLFAFFTLAAVAGGAWWLAQRPVAAPSAAVTVPVATSPEVAPPVVVLTPSAATPVSVPAALAQLAPETAKLAESNVSAAVPPPAPAVASPVKFPPMTAQRDAAQREPATLGLRMDKTFVPRKLSERAATAERAGAPSAEQAPKIAIAGEALERAQALWNSGSRDAAIDLLHDAVAVAERSGAGTGFAQGNPVLLPLLRELTRMQLAESRHSAVWDTLTRLEPQLGSAPDLWAIRASAAQRLGRHQDSVHAYMTALQSRPNEQRWMLGAAVSLAALGQTGSAAEMADKARAVGVVSPDVLAYLRQMGVPLKDK